MRRVRGQSSSELTLVISAIVLAVLSASTTLVPLFQSGVRDLGNDAKSILEDGSIDGAGAGGSRGNGGAPSTDPAAARPNEVQDVGNAVEYAAPLGKGAKEVIETRENIVSPNIGRPLDS